ncbi:hypothetical protein PY650_06075 [Rhizobium calliandrae]|uniref:Uncharacterized protein n=1 Tax=Rhizobium calliandrae TaxID=1312182 RepID=A0ABT7KAN9_9HYPH|nr:hypothetical protein [Rhizobium calliandrae]MDL2405227.1 hypothetical protein [Rhizobium calliandrae]
MSDDFMPHGAVWANYLVIFDISDFFLVTYSANHYKSCIDIGERTLPRRTLRDTDELPSQIGLEHPGNLPGMRSLFE